MTEKRTTLTTIKSFIRRNLDDLYIMNQASFDPMTGCVENRFEAPSFAKIKQTKDNINNTLGIKGAWFTRQTKNSFNEYKDNYFIGYQVCNCCGSFILAIQRN